MPRPNMDGLAPEVREYFEEVEKALEAATETIETLTAETKTEETAPTGNEVLKSASPELVELIKSYEARAASAEAIAKGLADQAADAEFISKAASLDSIGADTTELGKAMRVLATANSEAFGVVHKALLSANEVAKAGKVIGSEIGTSAPNTGAAATVQFETLAKSFVAEGKAKTITEAYTLVAQTNPHLYADHVNSVRKGA